MIWLHPWALLGIIGIAIPLAIHLLGRGHAESKRFPSLRFVAPSRLMPTRRTRIQDPLLLILRMGTIALASIALAHPIIMTSARRATLDRGIARAIVIDTSWSIRSSAVAARDAAEHLAATANVSIIVRTNEPGRAIGRAAAWIAKQQREGEIVVVSDFQSGTIQREDLLAVPREIGISFVRIGTPARVGTRAFIEDGRTVTPSTRTAGSETTVQWTSGRDSISAEPRGLTLIAAARDSAPLQASRIAAETAPLAMPLDSSRSIAVVFAGGDGALARDLHPLTRPWMADLLVALRRDSVRVDLFGERSDGQLVLSTSAAPGTVESARLIARARESLSAAPAISELDATTLSDDTLRQWSRVPSQPNVSAQTRPLNDEGPSDARWFWIGALVLLALETVLRRAVRQAATIEEARAHAA